MEEISAVIVAHNEEKQLPRLFESLKGIKDIVLIDHKSTDGTAKLAKKLGARVYEHDNHWEIVTKEDVEEFKYRYGFDPGFKVGQKMPVCYKDRNRAQRYAKNDWVYFPDCDEIVTWDLEEIKKLLPGHDMITYKFVNDHMEDGSDGYTYILNKLYRKSKSWWKERSHEGLWGHDLRKVFTDKMEVHHYQAPKPQRLLSYQTFEFNLLKDQSANTYYYLGREYHNIGMYERGFNFVKEYLKIGNWTSRRFKTYIVMARCMWNLGRENEAQMYCFMAMQEDPTNKEAFELMAQMSVPSKSGSWVNIAKSIPAKIPEI